MPLPTQPTAGGSWTSWGQAVHALVNSLEQTVATQASQISALTGNQGTTAPTGGTTGPNIANLWKAPQQVDTYAKGQTELAPIAAQPQAKWVLGTETQAQIAALASAAAGKTITLCVYAIPGRDNGQYSAGGLASASAYLAYIRTIIAGLGTAPAIVIIEPDAAGFASQLTGQTRTDRLSLLNQTLALFAAVTTIECYIDIATWATDPTTVLKAAGISQVKGFSLNVSGFNAQADCFTFADNLVASLATTTGGAAVSGMKYIIDTSRNGAGALTTAFPGSAPWFAVDQPWCNPPGRRLGLLPGTTDSGHPALRANLWVKSPGETDGSFPSVGQSSYYGASAPAAGTFWVPAARDLLGLAPYSQGTAVAGEQISNVQANFASTAGAQLVNAATGVTVTGGRGRIPINQSYASLSTAPVWTLVSSATYARVYPSVSAPSGATTATTSMNVLASVKETRLRIVVDRVTGKIKFASEVAYYDVDAVTIDFDAVSMAWWRIRDNGGKVYFETSPDGSAWTARRTITSPAWVHAKADQALLFDCYCDAGTGYSEIDNVGVLS